MVAALIQFGSEVSRMLIFSFCIMPVIQIYIVVYVSGKTLKGDGFEFLKHVKASSKLETMTPVQEEEEYVSVPVRVETLLKTTSRSQRVALASEATRRVYDETMVPAQVDIETIHDAKTTSRSQRGAFASEATRRVYDKTIQNFSTVLRRQTRVVLKQAVDKVDTASANYHAHRNNYTMSNYISTLSAILCVGLMRDHVRQCPREDVFVAGGLTLGLDFVLEVGFCWMEFKWGGIPVGEITTFQGMAFAGIVTLFCGYFVAVYAGKSEIISLL
ncbi:hypothetical protein BC829DRAFT_403040 [Chytridium lagenaria]|nr:hypothetical protein BC829DRAFT_403040 [Chytridium lagenaria]